MMEQTLLDRYQKLRRKHPHIGVANAIQCARAESTTTSWISDSPHEADGFEIVVKVDYDNYDDLSYLGEYTDKWDAEAIDLWAHKHALYTSERRPNGQPIFYYDWEYYQRREGYRYWVPTQTYREHYTSLLKMKYGRSEADTLARSYVKRDFERMQQAGQSWWMECITVHVYRNGILLASTSCGGIESDSERSFYEENADDLVNQAMDEARSTLDSLCLGR